MKKKIFLAILRHINVLCIIFFLKKTIILTPKQDLEKTLILRSVFFLKSHKNYLLQKNC